MYILLWVGVEGRNDLEVFDTYDDLVEFLNFQTDIDTVKEVPSSGEVMQ